MTENALANNGHVSGTRFAQLAALKDGWNGHGAKATTEAALRVAANLHVIPLNHGGLTIEWHCNGQDVEIDINGEGKVSVMWWEDEPPSRSPAAARLDEAFDEALEVAIEEVQDPVPTNAQPSTDAERTLGNVDACAARIGSTVPHVRRLVATRAIPFIRVGRKVRFDLTIGGAVDHWLDDNTVQPPS